jgi:hypothetical protein
MGWQQKHGGGEARALSSTGVQVNTGRLPELSRAAST